MTREPSVIVKRLGRENADHVARIAGGTRVSVPSQLSKAARLKRLFGDRLAILLVLHFGGNVLCVPIRVEGDRSRGKGVNINEVERLTGLGWSAASIARELHCTERAVYGRRAKLRRRDARNSDGNEETGS